MDIKGKNAVVTGAASGIGRAIVSALARAGIGGIVIADIDEAGARQDTDELRARGVKAAFCRCDVTSENEVAALADFAWEEFGEVDLLFSNAGVTAPGDPFSATENDTRWEFDVNVFGAIHCCRIFGRRFMAGGAKRWICITASHNSLGAPYPDVAGYVATKHAVLGYADALRSQFGEKLGLSVLCPGPINTRVWDAGRSRPAKFGGPVAGNPANEEYLRVYGMQPDRVGEMAVNGVSREEFIILTHPEDLALARKRYEEVRAAVQRQFPNFSLPS
jgi:NAD(P)-dependent dehydrogenase (short-subunit alcohol dehydrogenase family)